MNDDIILSDDLQTIYNNLDDQYRKLFIKVFKLIYHQVNERKSILNGFNAVMFHYWCLDCSRSRSGLNPSFLAILSFIYYVSDQGKRFVWSRHIYNAHEKKLIVPGLLQTKYLENYISQLITLGYLTRSSVNHDEPYLQSSHKKTKQFIKMTSKAIDLLKSFETDLYNIIFKYSLFDLISNKKALTGEDQGND